MQLLLSCATLFQDSKTLLKLVLYDIDNEALRSDLLEGSPCAKVKSIGKQAPSLGRTYMMGALAASCQARDTRRETVDRFVRPNKQKVKHVRSKKMMKLKTF